MWQSYDPITARTLTDACELSGCAVRTHRQHTRQLIEAGALVEHPDDTIRRAEAFGFDRWAQDAGVTQAIDERHRRFELERQTFLQQTVTWFWNEWLGCTEPVPLVQVGDHWVDPTSGERLDGRADTVVSDGAVGAV